MPREWNCFVFVKSLIDCRASMHICLDTATIVKKFIMYGR